MEGVQRTFFFCSWNFGISSQEIEKSIGKQGEGSPGKCHFFSFFGGDKILPQGG